MKKSNSDQNIDLENCRKLLAYFCDQPWYKHYTGDIVSAFQALHVIEPPKEPKAFDAQNIRQRFEEDSSDFSKKYEAAQAAFVRLGFSEFILTSKDNNIGISLSKESAKKLVEHGLPIPAAAMELFKPPISKRDITRANNLLETVSINIVDKTPESGKDRHTQQTPLQKELGKLLNKFWVQPTIVKNGLQITAADAATLYTAGLSLPKHVRDAARQWTKEKCDSINKLPEVSRDDLAEGQRLMDAIANHACEYEKYKTSPGGRSESAGGWLSPTTFVPFDFITVGTNDLTFVDPKLRNADDDDAMDQAAKKLKGAFNKVGIGLGFYPSRYPEGICFTPQQAATLFSQGLKLPVQLENYAKGWIKNELNKVELAENKHLAFGTAKMR